MQFIILQSIVKLKWKTLLQISYDSDRINGQPRDH